MTDREPTCAKCGKAMEAGFVLDYQAHATGTRSAWIDGAPEPSFWTGVKLKGHQRLPITTYRYPDAASSSPTRRRPDVYCS